MPWPAHVAGAVGALSGVPFLFLTAVSWAYVGDPDGGPWQALGVTALTVGQFAGVVLLRTRRSWQVLAGASLAVVVSLPVAVIVTWGRTGEPAAGTVTGVASLVAGPLVAALLATSPAARRWGSRPPSPLPAGRQPGTGLRP